MGDSVKNNLLFRHFREYSHGLRDLKMSGAAGRQDEREFKTWHNNKKSLTSNLLCRFFCFFFWWSYNGHEIRA